MVLKIEKEDNRFRIQTQDFSIDWLPETPENRKVSIVFLRLLQDKSGKPLFTLQQLSKIVDSSNRQAASQHLEDFRDSGQDFKDLLTRQRKVNGCVVSAVKEELMSDPLATIAQLRELTNKRLLRNDLTDANIIAALDQIEATFLKLEKRASIFCDWMLSLMGSRQFCDADMV